MASERAFVQGALQGIFTSIGFAFLVLILVSQNFYQTIFSILSIIGTVASIVSLMVWMGWELGVSESVACVIIIGFSVDYVVHLATHYIHAPFDHRFERMKYSLEEMGVSIVSGAITTLGSGLFLFGALILLF
jgi:protein dispatched 1